MIHTRRIGKARITSVLEYAAPTHDPAFLFPDLPQTELTAMAHTLAPHHYIPAMNRLIVSIRLWLVQIEDKTILIDTGVGNDKARAAARMNRLNTRIPEWLEAAGAGFDTVTHVLLTHLHMDHTGWNTVPDGNGGWRPAFPNAQYIAPARDFAHYEKKLAQGPDPIMDDSWNDSILPIWDAGLLDLLPADAPDAAGLFRPDPVPGHTPGMTGYHLDTGDGAIFFCGDVFHSPAQILKPDLNTAYCALPDQARATRARVLNEAAATGALICPMHFGAPHCGYIRRAGDGFAFEGAEWPPLTLPR
jgi:glyoxylase-like metal-dependent hydrolase (beta-lactamase superfamily II)